MKYSRVKLTAYYAQQIKGKSLFTAGELFRMQNAAKFYMDNIFPGTWDSEVEPAYNQGNFVHGQNFYNNPAFIKSDKKIRVLLLPEDDSQDTRFATAYGYSLTQYELNKMIAYFNLKYK